MYMATIGSAIMESLAAFETAVKQALHHEDESPENVAAPLLDAIQIIREAGETQTPLHFLSYRFLGPSAESTASGEQASGAVCH
jgi:hypothetical protein